MSASTVQELERPTNWPRMRPRFIVEVPCGADLVMDALRAGVPNNAEWMEGQLSERHADLAVREQDRRFWSTRLGLTIEEIEAAGEGGVHHSARVLGIFSPQPEIWTAYVFVIGTLTAIAVFGAMVAVVQLTLGHTPWAFLVPPFAVLSGGLVYTSTLVGQGLALSEMYQLRRHVDDCLAEAEARARQAHSDATPSV